MSLSDVRYHWLLGHYRLKGKGMNWAVARNTGGVGGRPSVAGVHFCLGGTGLVVLGSRTHQPKSHRVDTE